MILQSNIDYIFNGLDVEIIVTPIVDANSIVAFISDKQQAVYGVAFEMGELGIVFPVGYDFEIVDGNLIVTSAFENSFGIDNNGNLTIS